VPRIVKIETAVVVPAAVYRVWDALLDQNRWVDRLPDGAPVRIEQLEPLDETFVRVGDRRRCAAVIDQLPLVGRRRLSWEEQVTDVDPERTLEVESVPSRDAIRRWRVRFWLVPQSDGATRVCCYVSYRPATFIARAIDALFLRRRITLAADSWLTALATSFAPAEIVDQPAPELSEALIAA